MKKRLITAAFTLAGAVIGLLMAIALEKLVFEGASGIPAFVEMGSFFALPAVLAAGGGLLAAIVCPIAPFSKDVVFRNCVLTVLALSVTGVFLLSAGGQLLYELSVKKNNNAVVIALDQSGSMKGARNNNTIKAAQKLVDSLSSKDKVGLVFFGRSASVKVEMKQASPENKELIKQEIRKLKATEGSNVLQLALDESVKLLEKEDTETKGIFFVSDLDGADDLSLMGELDKQGFIEKQIPLYSLVINASENPEMRDFSEQTGGKSINTNNPDDIEELYMSMFYEFYQDDLKLNSIRPDKKIDLGRILISSMFYTLLGVLMSAVYTILYNNRHVLFIWNAIMGITSAVIVEVNNITFREPILMILAILIIFPTIYLGALPKDSPKLIQKTPTDTPIQGPEIFEEGYILK